MSLNQGLTRQSILFPPQCGINWNFGKPKCQFAKLYQISVNNSDWMPSFRWSKELLPVYHGLWLLHPALHDCVKVFPKTDAKAMLLQGLYNQTKDFKVLLEKQSHSKIRKEIDELCRHTPYSSFCLGLPEMITLTDAFELVKNEKPKGPKWNAFKLHFATLQLLKPRQYQFISKQQTTNTIQTNIDQIFNYVKSGTNNKELKELIAIFPPQSSRFRCHYPKSKKLPTGDNTIKVCFLWKISSLIRKCLRPTGILRNGKILKRLNTNIEYKQFLTSLEDIRSLETAVEKNRHFQNTHERVSKWVQTETQKTRNERFRGLRSYFQRLAFLSKSKFKAEIDFIEGRLNVFKTGIQSLSGQLATNLCSLLTKVYKAVVGKAMLNESLQIVIHDIISVVNPLQIVFSDSRVLGAEAQTFKIGDKLERVPNTTFYNTVSWSFEKISAVTVGLDIKLQVNKKFLSNLKRLIDNIKVEHPLFESGHSMNYFLENYENYNPNISNSEIIVIRDRYTDFVKMCCDFIANTTAGASSLKADVEKSNLCPNSKVLIEKTFQKIADLNDFQFEFIDAMASAMQALVIERVALNITVEYEKAITNPNLKADTSLIMNTLFAYEIFKLHINGIVEEFCDILTYMEGGTSPKKCLSLDIHGLKAPVKPTCIDRDQYFDVPIKPRSKSDTAFMNITDLYAGREVTFKIPDAQWLVQHNWIRKSDKDSTFVVKKFDVYLPTSSTIDRLVRCKAKAFGENKLFTNSNIHYTIIPQEEFTFEYIEGNKNTPCKSVAHTFSNPYGSLPHLCRLDRVDNKNCLGMLQRTPLFPSVFSAWKNSISGYESVPVPQHLKKDFKLKVGVKICVFKPTKNDHSQLDQADERNIF